MSNLLEDASIVITPTGYDNGTINATLPIPALGLDADLDFTRNGSANRTDSDGLVKSVSANIPRIDYSGQGNEFVDIGGVQTYRYVLGNLYPFEDPRGTYLFESQSTNKIEYSEDFSNASWIKKNSTVVSSNILNPKGEAGCYEYVADDYTGNDQYIRIGNTTYDNDLVQTYSFYVKYSTKQYLKLSSVNFNNTDNFVVNFDVLNGVKVDDSSTGTPIDTGFSIEEVFNGWHRISITAGLASAPGDSMNFELNFTDSATPTWDSFGRVTQTTTTSDKVYIWGAQLEEGNLTSYIPTEAATSTRLADKASKSNVGSFINSEEGTMIIEGFSSGTDGQITLSNGTPQDTMQIRFLSGDKIIFISKLNNSATSFIQSTSKLINVFYNIAVTWKTNEFKLYIDGALAGSGTGTVAAANTYNRLGLDRGNSGGSFFQGGFAKLEVWEKALTAAEIACQNTI